MRALHEHSSARAGSSIQHCQAAGSFLPHEAGRSQPQGTVYAHIAGAQEHISHSNPDAWSHRASRRAAVPCCFSVPAADWRAQEPSQRVQGLVDQPPRVGSRAWRPGHQLHACVLVRENSPFSSIPAPVSGVSPHQLFLGRLHVGDSAVGDSWPRTLMARMDCSLKCHGFYVSSLTHGGRRRKSPQWFALTRPHAELIAADTHFVAVFNKHCRPHFNNRCGCVMAQPHAR